jgi:hypothetical protein
MVRESPSARITFSDLGDSGVVIVSHPLEQAEMKTSEMRMQYLIIV